MSKPRALTKSELIDRVFANHGSLTSKEAEQAVNMILQAIVEAMAHGARVEIRSFGSFHLKLRGSRMGRNPRTGERIPVESKYVSAFKAGTKLKSAVNQAFISETKIE